MRIHKTIVKNTRKWRYQQYDYLIDTQIPTSPNQQGDNIKYNIEIAHCHGTDLIEENSAFYLITLHISFPQFRGT